MMDDLWLSEESAVRMLENRGGTGIKTIFRQDWHLLHPLLRSLTRGQAPELL